VGRLSGDEFAVILPGLADPSDAAGLADRVVACFDAPFRLDGWETEIGTSVGVAVHDPRERTSAEELLRRADAAMYRHEERALRSPAEDAR
jgi:GGDEF domain-containing protein